jgi:hypothetical protein
LAHAVSSLAYSNLFGIKRLDTGGSITGGCQ